MKNKIKINIKSTLFYESALTVSVCIHARTVTGTQGCFACAARCVSGPFNSGDILIFTRCTRSPALRLRFAVYAVTPVKNRAADCVA